MILFTVCGILMAIGLVIRLFITNFEFDALTLHITAYGFLLVGLGYIICLLNKREKLLETLQAQVQYTLDKKNREMAEDIRNIRALILKLEEKRALKETGERPAVTVSSGPAGASVSTSAAPLAPPGTKPVPPSESEYTREFNNYNAALAKLKKMAGGKD